MRINYASNTVENLSKGELKVGPIPEFSVEQVKEFKHIFKYLNKKDRDILYLIFVSRLKQKAVQRILDRSQPSLCYDIKRIKKRLKFIYYLNDVLDEFIEFMENHATEYEPEMVEILTLMFYTTSLTHTAKVLDQPQIKVRYKFERTLQMLEMDQQWAMYELFDVIRHNLNIIKRFDKEE